MRPFRNDSSMECFWNYRRLKGKIFGAPMHLCIFYSIPQKRTGISGQNVPDILRVIYEHQEQIVAGCGGTYL
jgi:hypothetical protein